MPPSTWKKVRVDNILERVNLPVKVGKNTNYREIGIRSHAKGIFHKEPVTGKTLGNKRVFHIEPNCFVVNIVFAWEQAIAKTTENEYGMIASHRFPMYRPIKERCCIDYILYFFKSKLGKHTLTLASPGGAGRNKTLGQSEFNRIEILIPSVLEQRKIAETLSVWDQAIKTTEKLIKNSKLQKKALMQRLLTGKKQLPGFRGEFTRHHLSEIVEIDRECLSNKTDMNFLFQYISLSDIEEGKVSNNLESILFKNSPSRARRIVKKGDILLATVRPNLQNFAKIEEKNDEMIASTGFSVLTPKDGVCGSYIYHYLFSAHITGQINSLVVGSNYPAINSSDVSGLLIYCPDYSEQIAIAELLDTCDQTTNHLQSKVEYLTLEKNALMQQLLTGKRRVKV